MAETIGEALVAIKPDLSKFGPQIKDGVRQSLGQVEGDVKQSTGRMSSQLEDGGRRISSGLKGIIAAAGAAFAIREVGQAIKGAVQAAAESEKIGRITAQVIEQTGGAANISAEGIGKLANALAAKTGVDDEAIQSAQNVLLTFKNVANAGEGQSAIFDRASAAALDLSTVLGGDLNGATLQLGKALNDPVAGISALSRAGVQFTDQQKEQIKTLVASNDVLGAQKIILAEVEGQLGGAAEAAASPFDKLKVVVGNLQETFGSALLPVLAPIATALTDIAVAAEPVIKGLGEALAPILKVVGEVLAKLLEKIGPPLQAAFQKLSPVIEKLGEALGDALLRVLEALLPILPQLIDAFITILDAMIPLLPVVASLIEAIAPMLPVLLPIILALTGPTGLVLALAMLLPALGGLVEPIQNFGAIVADVFNGAIEKIGEFIGWLKDLPGKVLDFATRIGSAIVNGIIDGLSAAGGAIADLGIGLFNTIAGFINDIMGQLEGGINAVIGFVNDKIPGFIDVSIPEVSLPRITELAAGGITRARPGGSLGLLGEAGSDEATIPLGSASGQRALASALAAAGAGRGGVVFEAGSVVVEFHGVVPSEAEAFRTGQAVGGGIADTLTRRDVRVAARAT